MNSSRSSAIQLAGEKEEFMQQEIHCPITWATTTRFEEEIQLEAALSLVRLLFVERLPNRDNIVFCEFVGVIHRLIWRIRLRA